MLPRLRRSNGRPRTGAALIEATLTILLFLLFIFTIVDFGIATYLHHTLAQRARTAVRKAVVELGTYDATKIQNLIMYDSVTASGDPFLGLTASNITVYRPPASIDGQADRLIVTIADFRFPLFTYLVAGSVVGKPIVINLAIEDNNYLGYSPV